MENTKINSDQIRAEIEKQDEEFVNTYNRGDARGLVAFYAEKGMVMPPNENIVEGSQQIESFWQAMMNLGAKHIKLQVLEAEQHEDTAYEVGRATILGEGNQALDDVKYLVIWKRENGAWKIYRDIFNSNNKVQQA
jgi:ketosteroid isomerase-like protein